MRKLNEEQSKKAWDWIEEHAYELLTKDPYEKAALRKAFVEYINTL